MQKKINLFFILLISLSTASKQLHCQPQLKDKDLQISESSAKEKDLVEIIESIKALKIDFKNKQAELQSPSSTGIKDEVQKEVQELSNEISTLENNLSEIITEIPSEEKEETSEKNFSWSSEIIIVLSPLINELKLLTKKPRELDSLKNSIINHTVEVEKCTKALKNISILQESSKNKLILKYVDDINKSWENKLSHHKTLLAVDNQKLEQRLSEKQSFTESTAGVFKLFFKSRGRNLLISLFASIIFALLMRKFYDKTRKINPKRDYTRKVLQVSFLLLSIVGSVLVFLICLFLFGDWVLLILAILIIVALLWAAKEALPKFWNQLIILMNMGPVREKEIVVYNGIPWKVKSLNFLSILENPELTGGIQKLPIVDLMELRSRYFSQSESLFPTKKNDWVILKDGKYGKVSLQTPNTVTLEEKGGSQVTYITTDFLSLNPKNLSRGFRISVVFGLDYKHQSTIVTEIIPTLQKYIQNEIEKSEFNAEKIKIRCEFKESASSSLNIHITADAPGIFASRYQPLSRFLNKLCLNAANEYNWSIPFDALTVHLEKQNK